MKADSSSHTHEGNLKMKTVTTMEQFVEAAKTLDNSGIYDMIEDATPALRNEILAIADQDSPEPFRSAMIKLGHQYGVPSLINY